MPLSGRITCAALLVMLAGCASQQSLLNLRGEVDEAKSRVFQLEKELKGIKAESQEAVDGSLKGFRKELEAVRKAQADLQAGLDGVRVDLQVAAGKVDDLRLLAQKPADDMALLKEDIDRRLTQLQEKTGQLEKGLDDLLKKAAEVKAKGTEAGPEALYQRGLDTFKGGEAAKARELLARFLELYPKHELAANAHYWLGETHYSEKNYEQAILEFQEVIKNYPGKEKVPAAMLKQGMAFKELGDAKSARFILKKLTEDFPLADETARAKERLKELK